MYNLNPDKSWIDASLATENNIFLAYVLADKLCIKEASSSLMGRFMDLMSQSENIDTFNPTLIQTMFDFPDCAVTNFLIAHLACNFAEHGYDWYCGCKSFDDGETCPWCEFITNGGPMVIKLMKSVKVTQKERIHPLNRGELYWINQAREQQSGSGGNAHESERDRGNMETSGSKDNGKRTGRFVLEPPRKRR